MELALLQGNALAFLFRWIHLLAGVAWIGLLWYFNFVQGEYFKEAEASSKTDAIRKLVPRALWWFRWGAMFTFISGVAMLGAKHLTGYGIWVGSTLGILMFLNVWLIIWPNQKIVIASAKAVAAGGDADPNAAAALGKAGLASRTNTLFSIPMLFFMGSSAHYAHGGLNGNTTALIVSLGISLGIAFALGARPVIGLASSRVVGVGPVGEPGEPGEPQSGDLGHVPDVDGRAVVGHDQGGQLEILKRPHVPLAADHLLVTGDLEHPPARRGVGPRQHEVRLQ